MISDGRRLWGRMDTCICMAESLHCSPETIKTLLITIPQYKIKKFRKKGNDKCLNQDDIGGDGLGRGQL